MLSLEAEFKLVGDFNDEEEVEHQVGGIIQNLGCTKTENSKFYMTLELYWHIKMMVALGMLPKDQEFWQLKRRMEALEV
jgi:hypothetical protein